MGPWELFNLRDFIAGGDAAAQRVKKPSRVIETYWDQWINVAGWWSFLRSICYGSGGGGGLRGVELCPYS
eukprot:jgi/Picsp_1/5830/NSC_03189-R1_---NA---